MSWHIVSLVLSSRQILKLLMFTSMSGQYFALSSIAFNASSADCPNGMLSMVTFKNSSMFLCLSSLARILFTFTVSAIIVKRGLSLEFDASAIWHCIMGEVTLTAGFVAVASVIVQVTVPRVR